MSQCLASVIFFLKDLCNFQNPFDFLSMCVRTRMLVPVEARGARVPGAGVIWNCKLLDMGPRN